MRDAVSRCVLAVRHLPAPTDAAVRRVLTALFRRHGLPRALQMDNGTPFCGNGPRGWSSLTVWWLRLGLQVVVGRPGCPQDNGAHEQMHRILKAETVRPPAATAHAQQRRFNRWRLHYNRDRATCRTWAAATAQLLPAQPPHPAAELARLVVSLQLADHPTRCQRPGVVGPTPMDVGPRLRRRVARAASAPRRLDRGLSWASPHRSAPSRRSRRDASGAHPIPQANEREGSCAPSLKPSQFISLKDTELKTTCQRCLSKCVSDVCRNAA